MSVTWLARSGAPPVKGSRSSSQPSSRILQPPSSELFHFLKNRTCFKTSFDISRRKILTQNTSTTYNQVPEYKVAHRICDLSFSLLVHISRILYCMLGVFIPVVTVFNSGSQRKISLRSNQVVPASVSRMYRSFYVASC